LTRKRFIKLCMSKTSRKNAIKLAGIARNFDSYKQAYQYMEITGIRMFKAMFQKEAL